MNMFSVTTVANNVKQPYGGYVPAALFNKIQLNDGKQLEEHENLHATIIGLAVDYLTRFLSSKDPKVFSISMLGAMAKQDMLNDDSVKTAINFAQSIHGLDDQSIISVCKLATFDVWYRNPMFAGSSKQHYDTMPDAHTISNIRIMVSRSLDFFAKYDPVTKYGFSFNKKAFTPIISSGDGDFLTKDTLWDFKVTKRRIDKSHTLQLAIYYLMGKHSKAKEFRHIRNIGIFNPRLNQIHIKPIADIPTDTLRTIETDIIGYKSSICDSLRFKWFGI